MKLMIELMLFTAKAVYFITAKTEKPTTRPTINTALRLCLQVALYVFRCSLVIMISPCIKNLFQNLRNVNRSLVRFITSLAVNTAVFSTVDNNAVAFYVRLRIYCKNLYVFKRYIFNKTNVKGLIEEQGRYYNG